MPGTRLTRRRHRIGIRDRTTSALGVRDAYGDSDAPAALAGGLGRTSRRAGSTWRTQVPGPAACRVTPTNGPTDPGDESTEMSSMSSPRYSWSTCCYSSVARNFKVAPGAAGARGSTAVPRILVHVLNAPRVPRYRRPRLWSEQPRQPRRGVNVHTRQARRGRSLGYPMLRKRGGRQPFSHRAVAPRAVASRVRTVAFRKCVVVTRGPNDDDISLPRRGVLATARPK